MCQYYFSCFYIIENRFKETLNRLKDACPESNVDIGKTIKSFKKTFAQELKMRNRIHHHEPFDDVEIDRIALPAMMATEGSKIWDRRHLSAYRRFSREWSRFARDRSRVMETAVESVASVILREASFLQFP
jgi:hypothetical protein